MRPYAKTGVLVLVIMGLALSARYFLGIEGNSTNAPREEPPAPEFVRRSLKKKINSKLAKSEIERLNDQFPRWLLHHIEALHLLMEKDLGPEKQRAILKYAGEITHLKPEKNDLPVRFREQIRSEVQAEFTKYSSRGEKFLAQDLIEVLWGARVYGALFGGPEHKLASVWQVRENLLKLYSNYDEETYHDSAEMFVRRGYPSDLLNYEKTVRIVAERLAPEQPLSAGSSRDRKLRRKALYLGLNYYEIVVDTNSGPKKVGDILKRLEAVSTRDEFLPLARPIQKIAANRRLRSGLEDVWNKTDDEGLLYEICFCIVTSSADWKVEFAGSVLKSAGNKRRQVLLKVLSVWDSAGARGCPKMLVSLFQEKIPPDSWIKVCRLLAEGFRENPTLFSRSGVRDQLRDAVIKHMQVAAADEKLGALVELARASNLRSEGFIKEYIKLSRIEMREKTAATYWRFLGNITSGHAQQFEKALQLSQKAGREGFLLSGVSSTDLPEDVISLLRREKERSGDAEIKRLISRILSDVEEWGPGSDHDGLVAAVRRKVNAIEDVVEPHALRNLSKNQRKELGTHIKKVIDYVERLIESEDLPPSTEKGLKKCRHRLLKALDRVRED